MVEHMSPLQITERSLNVGSDNIDPASIDCIKMIVENGLHVNVPALVLLAVFGSNEITPLVLVMSALALWIFTHRCDVTHLLGMPYGLPYVKGLGLTNAKQTF